MLQGADVERAVRRFRDQRLVSVNANGYRCWRRSWSWFWMFAGKRGKRECQRHKYCDRRFHDINLNRVAAEIGRVTGPENPSEAVTDIFLDSVEYRVLSVYIVPPMNAETLSFVSSLLCASQLAADSPEQAVRSEARNPVISHIPREAVASKAIASVGYSKHRHILEIQFTNGAIYRYLEVSPSVYRELIASDSKARYYDANIKGNYPSIRVRPRVTQ